MKILRFGFLMLLFILLLFWNVYGGLIESNVQNVSILKTDHSHSETYPPFIIIKQRERALVDRSPFKPTEDNPPVEYLYFCPIQNEEDLEYNEKFCEDVQCIFIMNTTNAYDETIRCQSEVIPFLLLDHKNETENALPVKLTLKAILPEQRKSIGQQIFTFLRSFIKEEELILGEISDKASIKFDSWNIYMYFLSINKKKTQTSYSIHFIQYRPQINETSAIRESHVEVNDIHTLRKDHYKNFDLELSYLMYNESKEQEAQGRSRITAQKLIPNIESDFEFYKKFTHSDINIAPILTEHIGRWNNIYILLQQASKEFKTDLVVYTGITNECRNDCSIHTFPLIRISYSLTEPNMHNVFLPIPRIWYHIVGSSNSDDSLIIVLLNDLQDSWNKNPIKTCSTNNSRWEPIFREFAIQNSQFVMFCELNKKILFKSEEETTLPKDSIPNPENLVIENIFTSLN